MQVHLLKKGEEVPADLAARVEAAEKANNESVQKAAGDSVDAPSSPSTVEAPNTAPLKEKVNTINSTGLFIGLFGH